MHVAGIDHQYIAGFQVLTGSVDNVVQPSFQAQDHVVFVVGMRQVVQPPGGVTKMMKADPEILIKPETGWRGPIEFNCHFYQIRVPGHQQ